MAMQDPRIEQLARVLVQYSVRVSEGERVLIEATDVPTEIVEALIDQVAQRGGLPVVSLKSNRILRRLYGVGSEALMTLHGEVERFRMEKMDVYIGVRGFTNMHELGDVGADGMQLYQKHWFHPVHMDYRVPKTRWVVLRWPTPAMAQAASMSTQAFEDFYFEVCTLDYERMSVAMNPLKELMDRTDRVHIKGPGDTDLRFSIDGIHAVKCDGAYNIPDGEVYTAPVRDSVEGVIAYNTPTHYQGTTFTDVRLTFQGGKIVGATSSDTERVNQILDTDEGSRHVGEFAIGCNPFITRAMKDTLFDEKIAGSFHFTPGAAYDDCDNGNRSAVHWDMVVIQTAEYGGGEIWFDDVLVRKNGLFVPPELQGLNPDNLKGA
jgi:aminopeptidase